MATSVPGASQAAASPRPAAPPQQLAKPAPAVGQPAPTGALVPSQQAIAEARPGIPADSPAMRLRVELEVGVPVRDFRVKNLLALEPGVVVESQWNYAEDLPLAAGRVQLAWTEFEVSETQLATRLTRLA